MAQGILMGGASSFLASLVAQTVKNLPARRETQVRSLGPEYPQRRNWQPTPVFLPGKSPGQRSLAGYSSWGPKESDTAEQLTFIHMESPALLQEFAQDHNRERFLFLWSEITRYPRADIVPETKQAFRN